MPSPPPIANASVRFNDDEVRVNAGVAQRLLAPTRVTGSARAEGYLGRTEEKDLSTFAAERVSAARAT